MKKAGLAPREIRTCPSCGTKFSATGDNGLCPVCVLLGASGDESRSSEPFNSTPTSEGDGAKTAPRLGVRRFEHYEVMLEEDGKPIELGRGAMGITYKAFDVDLRFPVTLKVISEKYVGDEAARLRFLREARAAAKVRHSNVASVFHLGRSGGEYFYAMEFVEGETLESLIKRSGRLEVKASLEITSQVAAGLAGVHEQGLVHRDIKPTNVMVNSKDDGRVTAKIIDLGLAKGVSEPASEGAISTPGAFAGTPDFASPEQFAGVGLDIRSDLYSLGVTLWEMLVGRAPFQGSAGEVMHQQQHAPLPLDQLKGLPQPVVVLLKVLLKKDPAERFQSPGELVKAIPLVTGAIEAGRSVTEQILRTISSQRPKALQKTANFPKRLVAQWISPRVHLLAWALMLLLIAAVILAVNAFYGARRPAAESLVKKTTPMLVSEKSIAVLPFESLSTDNSDAYFADGVQDEILSNLAKVSQLKVISRTSVMAYRPPGNRDVRLIAAALGVAHVVEGTVQRAGNRVRITTDLIDARTDEVLWSESYQRDLTDIFAIQNEIAQSVVLKMSVRLLPEEQKEIEERPTTNLEAYDLFLRTKELCAKSVYQGERDNLLKAITLLEEAIRKDPKFTLAYCLLARANDDLYHYWIDKTPDRRALADAAVDAAQRLEPDRPEVHLAAAYHLFASYADYERAGVQIALAQRSLPNSSEALWIAARIARRQGRFDDSTKMLEKAASLDPRNPDILSQLSVNYGVLRRYDDLEKIYDRLSEIEPDNPAYKNAKDWVAFLQTGDPTSLRASEDRLPSSIKDHGHFASSRFWEAVYSRDWAAARQILDISPDEELFVGNFVKAAIPRRCGEIWLAKLQGTRPMTDPRFLVARDELAKRVEQNPDEPELLSALGVVDAFLGRKQDAIQEARHAVEMMPATKDALRAPWILGSLAEVYAWTNETDSAFQQLDTLINTSKTPLNPQALKNDPEWEPLRKDPRFDQLLARLASHW